MTLAQIRKLQLSNFLTGLVFWYGIEKLFLKSIGITPTEIGYVSALLLLFTLLFDIPAGILADKWSRKGMLCLSAIALLFSSLILGTSTNFLMYATGFMFYGVFVVCTSGVYQASMYDSLYELGIHDDYSRINGRAYGLFLFGAGIANVLSGFIADKYGFRATFYLTTISCALNFIIMLTLAEPVRHKLNKTHNSVKSLRSTLKVVLSVNFIRILTCITVILTVIENFKSDFGQLYFNHYVSSTVALGILWAMYAFCWAFGSLVAHKLRHKLHFAVVMACLPLLVMGVFDKKISILLFMIQSIFVGIVFNLSETIIQDRTLAQARASVMSVVSSIGRLASIPASLLFGWIFRYQDAFYAIKVCAIFAVVTLILWAILYGVGEQLNG